MARVWALSLGGEVDVTRPVSSLQAFPQTPVAPRTPTQRWRPRLRSCFGRGILTIVGMLLCGEGLVLGRFVPDPWPTKPSFPKTTNAKIKAPVPQEAA